MRRQAREDRFVLSLVRGFTRSPGQLNQPHESDAELIRLPGSKTVLAITVDQIVEEVRTGLYADPFLLGWMTVTASASDLAAVGAEPLGVVIGQTFPADVTPGFRYRLQRGIARAADVSRLPVLGGDTARDAVLSTAATAFGVIPDGKPLTRRGAAAGHRVFASGPMGLGSAFAWTTLAGETAPDFLPIARLEAGALARGIAAAAVDTSDGFLAACDLLLPPDGLDLVLEADPAICLHPAARQLARRLSVPEWTLLAGPHGEFELVLAVPEAGTDFLLREAAARGIPLLELGRFRAGSGSVRIPWAGVSVDPARVRDLHPRAAENPGAFLDLLMGCARPSCPAREAVGHATG
jgi:thiamine-monophosphate kinase